LAKFFCQELAKNSEVNAMGTCSKCGGEVPDDKLAEHEAACQGGGQPQAGGGDEGQKPQ